MDIETLVFLSLSSIQVSTYLINPSLFPIYIETKASLPLVIPK